MVILCHLLLAMTGFISAQPLTAAFMAGTARLEITPPIGYSMGGYGARKGVSTGIHDPLFVTALVLKTEKETLVFITCDLVIASSLRVESEIQRRFGISNVLISSSHTHSGPSMRPHTRHTPEIPSAMSMWWKQTENKFIQAVGQANANLFPARIGAGTGHIHIGHNRRKVFPDGTVKMFWRNATKEPTRPVDPIVTVLRIDDSSGNPKVVLVNYSCHPTVLGPDNLQISADYVGVMREYVEKKIPGSTCLFIFGASGDINPYFDKQPITENPFEAVEWTGNRLGRTVVQTTHKITTQSIDENSLSYISKVHEVRHRFNADQTVKIATSVGVLSDTIGFVSFSADPFVQHQIRLREQSKPAITFVFAHTSTKGIPYAQYLPTIRAAVEGGYGADRMTSAEVGTGEVLVDLSIVQLLKLMGRLPSVTDTLQ